MFKRFSSLIALLSFLLLLGGFFYPGFFQLSAVPECQGGEAANNSDTSSYVTEAVLEQELLMLTNQQRVREGLKELVPDAALTQIAREHSHGMAQIGYISHDQPSGNLELRLRRAGYLYEVVRENIACARTISMAQSLMIDSPQHKNNILAADVTRVGIGVARYKLPFDNQIYITELFAVPRKKYPSNVVQNLPVN